MKSSQEDIALLESYLKGRLNEDSVRILKSRLAAEKALAEDLNELQILVQGMRVDVLDEKVRMLKAFEDATYKKDEPQDLSGQHPSLSGWKWWLALIGIVSFSWLAYYFFGKNQKKIPQEYQHIYADRFDGELILHKTLRAAVQTDSLSAAQRRAYELYSIQLFDEAIPLLDALWANQNDTLALFYLGVSKIGIGEIEEGAEIMLRSELKKYSEQTNIFIHH